ncbi:hypothetical protein A3A93_06220 [Candidatus Roizmanbacteria bacterium RIFCSPLOWO2_01_FULL_38_12]|uniref:Uncharacterized protein n=1 Tax=Candidatus Roizmanbacteria bacterium RIFCSPLOWO2_01_FULL_38_12 TaxID=1802061 RepID=A0A1F7ITY3_9BACT|nr:MAG: hypothetical protein A2861_01990 [Candidatus Roizmanbacteria bacterium RIFCSPHIGHO2_01_FULL_38_15]OGK34840.1 MAG: hypothetical protein A3F59_00535 [Candidatus Roizmanbacteria bacterium RIFCSPHIGHO2_12_FULL_38_13]OGK46825.1 MAG: hypothetical protein A3A93_06220 [Candidatus Roizmanbacteria bacterium RIFCSPLOWO2_01_FULL_38_12]
MVAIYEIDPKYEPPPPEATVTLPNGYTMPLPRRDMENVQFDGPGADSILKRLNPDVNPPTQSDPFP